MRKIPFLNASATLQQMLSMVFMVLNVFILPCFCVSKLSDNTINSKSNYPYGHHRDPHDKVSKTDQMASPLKLTSSSGQQEDLLKRISQVSRSLNTADSNGNNADDLFPGGSGCSVCGRLGVPLLAPETIPNPHAPLVTCYGVEFYAQYNVTSAESNDCAWTQNGFEYKCCDLSSLLPLHQCESNVRSQILNDYDSIVPPYSENGWIDVKLELTVYAIPDIDIKQSIAEVWIFVTMDWTDPRLAWDVGMTTDDNGDNSASTCVGRVHARASHDAELTEIWVPDIDLENRQSGLQAFDTNTASISSDGTVSWGRGGAIRAHCKFVGLRRIPYDTIGCRFNFGPWSSDYLYNITLGGDNNSGFTFGPPHITKASYAPYNLAQELAESSYTYGDPHRVSFDLYFTRARQHYVMKILVPNILFTYLSFGMFLIDLRVGERLAYGMSALLVIVAQDIVTSELLPICNERLWIHDITYVSMYFILCALLESVLVGYLYFRIEDKKSRKEEEQEQEEELPDIIDNNSMDNISYDNTEQLGDRNEVKSKPNDETNSDVGVDVDLVAGDHIKERKFQTFKQKLRLYSMGWEEKTIKTLDMTSLKVLPLGYTIFLIIMFSINSKYDTDTGKAWDPAYYEL